MRRTRPQAGHALRPLTRVNIWSQAQSAFGDALAEVALYWYVLSQTKSAVAVGVLAIVGSVTSFSVAVVGGPLSDRISPTRLMPVLDLLRFGGLAACIIVLGFGHQLVYPAFLAMIVVSGAGSLYSASAGRLVKLAEPAEHLQDANSRLQVLLGAGSMAGYAASAVLYSAAGLALCLGLDAATYAVAAAAIYLAGRRTPIAAPQKAESDRQERAVTAYAHEISGGARYLATNRNVRTLVLVAVVAVTALAPVQALSPQLVQSVLHEPVWGLTALEIAVMSGRIIGARAARHVGLDPKPLVRIGQAITFSVLGAGITALLPHLAAAVTGFLLMGACAGAAAVFTGSTLQRTVDHAYVGRVGALMSASLECLPLLGVAAGTVLSQHAGPRAAFAAISGVLAVTALSTRFLGWTAESTAPTLLAGQKQKR